MATAEISRAVSTSPSIRAVLDAHGRPTDNYQPLAAVLAAVCAGIVCDRFTPPSFVLWWCFALAAWLSWYALWRRGYLRRAAVSLLCSLVGIGGAWHHACWYLFEADELGLCARGNPEPICLEGVAVAGSRPIHAPRYDPLNSIPTSERTRIELQVTRVRDADRWRRASGSTSVIVQGQLFGVRRGDRLQIFGELHPVSQPGNPGEFDFAAHARAERRLCVVRSKFPECVTREQSAPWSFGRLVERLRDSGAAALHDHLDPSESGLAAAMFLGLREELEPEATQAFLQTGTIHLLVISGLNVGILAGFIFFALRAGLIGERLAIAGAIVATVLYAMVTDAQPPVVRATVLVVAICVARLIGRRSSYVNTLAAAGLFVLFLNPCDLFGAGTQLSFLGALGIGWGTAVPFSMRSIDPLDRLIAQSRTRPIRAVRRMGRIALDSVITSAVVWLLVSPLVAERFHLISPATVLLSPVLAVPVTLAMGFGFAVMLLGWLAPPVATLCGWMCDANLWFMRRSVDWFNEMSGSFFWTPGPSLWWVIGLYAMLFAWLVAGQFRPTIRWCAAGLTGWCALGLGAAWLGARHNDRLDCTFLSVGHGLAVVLELPGGQSVLYDAGELGSPAVPVRTISSFLWSRGITHLDAVVLSHSDSDHYNALPGLLKQFSVGTVYVSSVMFEDRSEGVRALHQAIDRAGVPIREIWGGDRLRTVGNCRIDVLHPPRWGVFGNNNANCVVLDVEYQRHRILLTGDLEGEGLKDVLAEEPIPCDVLLVPHHGSLHSDPPGIAEWSRPRCSIMSGGIRDRHAEVSEAYERRGSQVFHTANTGAVHVSIQNRKLAVDSWRNQRSWVD